MFEILQGWLAVYNDIVNVRDRKLYFHWSCNYKHYFCEQRHKCFLSWSAYSYYRIVRGVWRKWTCAHRYRPSQFATSLTWHPEYKKLRRLQWVGTFVRFEKDVAVSLHYSIYAMMIDTGLPHWQILHQRRQTRAQYLSKVLSIREESTTRLHSSV